MAVAVKPDQCVIRDFCHIYELYQIQIIKNLGCQGSFSTPCSCLITPFGLCVDFFLQGERVLTDFLGNKADVPILSQTKNHQFSFVKSFCD